MTNKIIGLAVALGSLVVGTSTARAAAILEFDHVGGQGTISYAGGASPLVVSGIPVTSVKGVGTPLNSGQTLTVTGACRFGGGCLTYTSGAFISNVGGVLTFAPGTFTIVGGIASLGLANTTVLVSSTSTTASIMNLPVPPPPGIQESQTTLDGLDSKNSVLVTNYFGTNTPISWDMDGTLTALRMLNTSAFVILDQVSQAITDTATLAPPTVPEPMSVVLLGTTMVGVVTAIRRRKKKSADVA